MTLPQLHRLVVYRSSERAEAAIRRLAAGALERNDRITILALAAEEPVSRGCCDTRSVLWNRITRELAEEELARARAALHHLADAAEFAVLRHNGRRAADALAQEARLRQADEIVLADPGACGLSRRDRRRLSADPHAPPLRGA
jgi:hypothetical protein